MLESKIKAFFLKVIKILKKLCIGPSVLGPFSHAEIFMASVTFFSESHGTSVALKLVYVVPKPFCWTPYHCYVFIYFKDFTYSFLERGEGRERGI